MFFSFSDVKNATGFFESPGRCTSATACSLEKLSFELEKEVEEDEEEAKKEFVLMSTGNASSYQGHALGVYTPLPDTGAYHQKGGDYYLYQDRDSWHLSPHITGCNKTYNNNVALSNRILGCAATWVAAIQTKDIHSVGGDWSYAKDKEWVNDDPTLQFVQITSAAAACITCTTVQLTSTGPAMQSKPDYLGVFTAVPGLYSAGRPVYKNHAGRFLMVKNEYTTFAVWDDVERRVRAGKGEEGGRSIRSVSAPTCVGETMTGGWQFREEEEWVQDETISAMCL